MITEADAPPASRTLPQKILLAASALPPPFSLESLVVAAWESDRRAFGLSGYADLHPDSKRVSSYLMGEKGLVKGRQWLASAGPKLYRLTPLGMAEVARLTSALPADSNGRAAFHVALPPADDALLRRLFASKAFSVFDSFNAADRRSLDMTFADALLFFGVKQADAQSTPAAVSQTEVSLRRIAALIGAQRAALSDGRSVSVGGVALLLSCHAYLAERFARHIRLIESRKDVKT